MRTFKDGQKIWLKATDGYPRLEATISGDYVILDEEESIVVEVKPSDRWDDGVREVLADDIE
jgi:hypothetical protein